MIDARRCSPIHLRTSAQDREEFVSASHRIGIITPITYGSHGEIIDGILQANRWAKRMCIPIPYKTQSLDRSAIKMAAVQAIRRWASAAVTVTESVERGEGEAERGGKGGDGAYEERREETSESVTRK